MTATRLKNPRRYRRASRRAGRLELLVAVGIVTLLLVGLAVVVLPSPLSTAVAVALVSVAVLLAFLDVHPKR